MHRCEPSLRAFRLGLVATLALVAAAPLAAATFTVNSTLDVSDAAPGNGVCASAGGDCSLRAAIEEANALAGPDSIEFNPILDGAPLDLSSQLPTVTTALTITGRGAGPTTVEASDCNPVTLPGGCTPATYRVFEVGAAGNLTLANLAIRYGNCAGACATAGNDGAGILNGGTLNLSTVVFLSNRAVSGNGGGIENRGTIGSILDGTFTGNRAGDTGGGIDNASGAAIGSIVRTVFFLNQAGQGGGIYAGQTGVISRSFFSGNAATVFYGGGIYADGNLGLVSDCTFDGNSSVDQGGGIYTDSSNAIGAITRSVFTGNSAPKGGGLREFDGSMGSITNSTFSGNTASETGGAIETRSGTIAGIVNVTITGNTSPLGAGIYTESNIPISNSIFGNNGAGANCAGTFTDSGGNFSDDASCNSKGSIVPGTDYSLILADNGGPTSTHALLPGSVAIDANGACPVALQGVDQRRVPRDGQCDSGAFEFNPSYIFNDGFE